ncbi:iron exporter MbfA [Kushneria aurantia]|uniref:Iron exporter MbfA n=1 Tax=Kushneria aurantia TaxID=504092 RepID=A0ABV6G1X1_9GAMM|nr:ferritin family protein [Kushneria aurantia]
MLFRFLSSGRDFDSLTEKEMLALAISSEEEDSRIYAAYADRLRDDFPASAAMFEGMAAEEDEHRRLLIDRYAARFGNLIVPVRREHVRGFITRRPVWLMAELNLDRVRAQAWEMEHDASRFYAHAAERSEDADTRRLLGDLARAERDHEKRAERLEGAMLGEGARASESETAKRNFVLTYVQPGLAGLMDGSVSTLAPIFAAAFATGDTWATLQVGLAASVGAGISMGFTEAASDDGKLTGRGSPVKRGFASGIMTTLGGLGHALPYLIPHFQTATTLAIVLVFIELWVIAWIQKRFMETPFWRAAAQVVLGGGLVFAAGVLIGSL